MRVQWEVLGTNSEVAYTQVVDVDYIYIDGDMPTSCKEAQGIHEFTGSVVVDFAQRASQFVGPPSMRCRNTVCCSSRNFANSFWRSVLEACLDMVLGRGVAVSGSLIPGASIVRYPMR